MPHDRPGDRMRDEWILAMKATTADRSWAFEDRGMVWNNKDNTPFRLNTARSAFPSFTSDEYASDVPFMVNGLLHASSRSGQWAISLEHLRQLQGRFERTCERFVVVLLFRDFETGVILYPTDLLPWIQDASGEGQLLITREQLRGLTWFDEISYCANCLALSAAPPGSSAFQPPVQRVLPSRPLEFCLSESQVRPNWFCPHRLLLLPRTSEGGLRVAADGCWIDRDRAPPTGMGTSGG
jgi:hypothetical protein